MSSESRQNRRYSFFIYLAIFHVAVFVFIVFSKDIAIDVKENFIGFSTLGLGAFSGSSLLTKWETNKGLAASIHELIVYILYFTWAIPAMFFFFGFSLESTPLFYTVGISFFPYVLLIYRDFVIGYEPDLKDEIRRLVKLGTLTEAEAEDKLKAVQKKEALKEAEYSIKSSEEYYSMLRLKKSSVLTEKEFNQKVEELKNRKVEKLMRE